MSEQNKESEWTKREMGAFWKRQSQKGQSYLSGHVTLKLDDGRLLCSRIRTKPAMRRPPIIAFTHPPHPNRKMRQRAHQVNLKMTRTFYSELLC